MLMRMQFVMVLWEQIWERFITLYCDGNAKPFPSPQNTFPKRKKRERKTFPTFPTETIVPLNETYLMKVSILLRKFAKSNNKPKVYFRVRDGKKDLKSATNMYIYEEYWDSKTLGYKRTTPPEKVPLSIQKAFNNKIKTIVAKIYDSYTDDLDNIGLSKLIDEIEKSFSTEAQQEAEPENNLTEATDTRLQARSRSEKTMVELFQTYLDTSHFNDWHFQAQTAVFNKVKRFEGWLGYLAKNPQFKLYLTFFDKAGTEEYLKYIENEHEYRESYPEYFDTIKLFKPNDIAPLSQNTLSCSMKRLFMFLNWAYKISSCFSAL